MPLVWAHAEYLKLLRSSADNKVFDRVDPVYERYCEPAGMRRRRHDVEIYSRRRPVQRIRAGETLRILDEGHFDVIWTDDEWKTTQKAPSRSIGSAGYTADVTPRRDSPALEWTLHWPDQDTWLGYNVEVKIDED